MRRYSNSQLLLLISLGAAIPRIYLGVKQHVDYDGYWNVFIAMQDNWGALWKDYQATLHPPLLYFLLKVSLWFGHSVLVYRAISILTGIGSVFIVGKIAEKLSLCWFTPVNAALAYGFALPAILVSNEVRDNMLCVFFVLASFYYFLDIVDGHRNWKSRIGFAALAILGIASNYVVFLYVFACGLAAAVFCIRSFRQKFLTRVALDVATFLPIASFGALMYYTHAQKFAVAHDYLSEFYFDPRRGETVIQFLFRNAQYLFNSFSPVEVEARARFGIVLIVLVLAAGFTVYMIRRPLLENNRSRALLLVATFILGSLIAGGLMRKYPFGGYLHQQFILFPFAVLSGWVLIDRVMNAVSIRRLSTGLSIAVILLTLGFSAIQFHRLPKDSTRLFQEEVNRFRNTFSSYAAVYVDQFSLIIFFMHYDDWNWHFVGTNPSLPTIQIYRVSKGTEQFFVVRDRARWNANYQEPMFYSDVAKVLRSQPLLSLTTFNIRQFPEGPSDQKNSALENQIVQLAFASKLCVKEPRLVTFSSTYINLTDGPCKTQPLLLAPYAQQKSEAGS